MDPIIFLRRSLNVTSIVAGGSCVFAIIMAIRKAGTPSAPKLLIFAALFFGAAILVRWLATKLPDYAPTRKRGKGLVDKILNLID